MGNNGKNVLGYTGVRATNPPQQVINRERAPTQNDLLNFNIGDEWLYMNMPTPEDSELYILVSKAENVAVWKLVTDTRPVWPNHAVVLGSGTEAENSVAPTTAGFVLTSNGPAADPTWQVNAPGAGIENLDGDTGTATGATVTIAGGTGITTVAASATVTVNLDSPVLVINGGTGDTALTAYAPMCGGTTAVSAVQAATTGMNNVGYVLTSTGTASLPTWQAGGGGGTLSTLTGDTGGAVPPTANNINIDGSDDILVAGNAGTSTLGFTLTTDFKGDTGTANTATGILNFVGTGGIVTSATANTITIDGSGSGGGGSGNLLNIQIFDTPGADTYTPTTGMEYVIVQCVGGGGGAGNAQSPGPGAPVATGGGGAGGFSQGFFDAATIGVSQALVIGAAGAGGAASGANAGSNGADTTFGSLITAGGGAGSVGAYNISFPPDGGVGGTAVGGYLNINGQQGAPGTGATTSASGGIGGSNPLGQGGSARGGAGAGYVGTGYGAGGGGSAVGTGGIGVHAANGTSGIVIVYEYGGGGGSGSLDTLTADTGGPISPTAGNINIVGGTNVTTSGSGDTITINATGGGSGITTLDGDTGTATGATVTIAGGTGITTVASSSTVTVNLDSPVLVINGGTGDTSLTAYAPMCGGTTGVSAVQAATTGMNNVGYVLTSTGTSSLPTWQAAGGGGGSGDIIDIQVFDTSGSFTYTPTAGMTSCIVECVGGGGGGGATPAGGAGGGGGAGGYSRALFFDTDIGVSQPLVVGAAGLGVPMLPGSNGGATTFGTGPIITANGGQGGGIPAGSTGGVGGDGGTASGGDLNVNGQFGGIGVQTILGGIGGSGIYGGGAYGAVSTVTALVATGYGSGGGGLCGTPSTFKGSDGVGGLVVITEFGGGGSGSLTLTGDTGGAVSATADNITIIGEDQVLEVTGNPGTSTLTIDFIAAFNGDTGSAGIATGVGELTIAGGTGLTSSATGSTVTMNLDIPVVVTSGGTGVTSTTEFAPVCGGTTGTAAFQSADSGIANVGYVLTSTGATSLPVWQSIGSGSGPTGTIIFDTPGADTYTPTAGTATIVVICVGGGGAGGSYINSTGTQAVGGGGAGATSQAVIQVIDLTFPYAIQVGAGGTASSTDVGIDGGITEFGTLMDPIYLGGGGGLGCPEGDLDGALGGEGAGGDFSFNGGNGGFADEEGLQSYSGFGGTSLYGAGGLPVTDNNPGTDGTGFGGGGSGCSTNTAGTVLGGNGSSGIVIIYEFEGGGGSGISELTADTGSATGASIDLIGGDGIITSATGATVTFDLDVPVAVNLGGTGITALTEYAPVCGGITNTDSLQSADTGISNSGYVLTSTGATSLPTWQSVSSSGGTIVTTYGSGSGTHNINAGTKFLDVYVVGAGSGGGSGRQSTSGNASGGGGGSAAIVIMQTSIPATLFGSTVAYQVGVGGSGGASQGSPDTDGLDGSAGTDSFFGNITAEGTTGGVPQASGGTSTIGAAGGSIGGSSRFNFCGQPTTSNGGDGHNVTAGANATPIRALSAPSSGGGGGGAVTGASTAGGTGGNVTLHNIATIIVAGGAGGAAGNDGLNGAVMSSSYQFLAFGTGGGGGGGSDSGVPGGDGGDGGVGSGGGGGGGSINGLSSGAGGNGGDGYIQVIEYL